MQDSLYSREEYATKQFWDNRYKEKQCYFDWYAEFPELKQTLQVQYGILHEHRILMLGCGNSKISEQMYEQGYHNIVNIDISQTVIEQMKKSTNLKGYTKMEWMVMDATDLKGFSDNWFDVIIDKGTLDALISGNNSQVCQKMLRQAVRVMKKQGQLIIITYGSPEGRRKYFQRSIGLTKLDYYFTRVDLSSMSTLINLMRSNLGNLPLRQITKDSETMKKTMMQYTLIKALRKNRKNQKKLIIWSEIKKQQEIELTKLKLKAAQNIISSDKVGQQREKQEINRLEQKKLTYSPKKQTFCLVYSIRLKFAVDLQEVTQESKIKLFNQQSSSIEEIKVTGDSNLYHVSIYAPNCLAQLQKALIYLEQKKMSYNPITFYKSEELFNKNEKSIKIKLEQGQQNLIPILSKTIYQIKINTKQKKGSKVCFQKIMEAISEFLVQKGGLASHPTPKNYSFLGYVLQKHQPKMAFNQLLKKYWYPTYRLKQSSLDHFIYQLSVPPSLDQSFCLNQIKANFLGYEQETILTHKGYINFFDPRVINLANFCSVNYSGTNTNQCLIIQQFSERSGTLKELSGSIKFQKKFMPHLFARLLSAL